MSISFSQLRFVEPSLAARRLLWHVLSIGLVSRDEPERHQGWDKAGAFVFRVVGGAGELEVAGRRYELRRGGGFWLLDLRQPRSYLPAGGRVLRTEGVRFSGPSLEAWLEVLGPDAVFAPGAVNLVTRLNRLRRLVAQSEGRAEWEIHEELTGLWGELLAARKVLGRPGAVLPPSVARVIDTVLADPARDWRARDLVQVAGMSYSRLRERFRAAQGRTLHAFLQSVRLDLARALLSDRRLSIKEAARRLNFSSEFYFSHFFHRGTGMSPTQFRERCRS